MGLYVAQTGGMVHSKGAARVRATIKTPGENGIPKLADPIRITFHFYSPDGTQYNWGYPSDSNPPSYGTATRLGVGLYEVVQTLGNVKGKWRCEVLVDGGANGASEVVFESADM